MLLVGMPLSLLLCICLCPSVHPFVHLSLTVLLYRPRNVHIHRKNMLNFIFITFIFHMFADLCMTACKRGEESVIRIERIHKRQVDFNKAYHVGDGPFKGIVINRTVTGGWAGGVRKVLWLAVLEKILNSSIGEYGFSMRIRELGCANLGMCSDLSDPCTIAN